MAQLHWKYKGGAMESFTVLGKIQSRIDCYKTYIQIKARKGSLCEEKNKKPFGVFDKFKIRSTMVFFNRVRKLQKTFFCSKYHSHFTPSGHR